MQLRERVGGLALRIGARYEPAAASVAQRCVRIDCVVASGSALR